MSTAPSISVIVPTYNRADLLPETLETILAQTLRPAEILVVDDGSTDATEAVVARHGPTVGYLRIPNSGHLRARNIGLERVSGALLAYCDSDDLWHPEFLATAARAWRLEPATRAAFANFRIIRDTEWTEKEKFAAAPPGYWEGLRDLDPEIAVFDTPVVERLIRFQPFFPSCMVVERAFFRAIGGWDEAMAPFVGRDFGTMLRLAEHPPIAVLRRPLVGIRKHHGNMSGDVQKMNLGDANVLETALRMRPSLAPYAAEIRASVQRRRLDALELAFARRDWAGVAEIRALLGAAALSGRVGLKARIAALPAPVRGPLASVLLGLGSMRAALTANRR